MSMQILLVGRLPALLSGLRHSLEAAGDVRVLSEERFIDDALSLARSRQPDAIVLGARPREADSPKAVPAFAALCPAGVVAMIDTPTQGMQALGQGAHGVWNRESEPASLLEAVRIVIRGGIWVEKETLDLVLSELTEQRCRGQREQELTRREREILALMSQGLDIETIARDCHNSPCTVRVQVSSLRRKLQLQDCADLQRYAHDAARRDHLLELCLAVMQASDAQPGALCKESVVGI